MKYAICVTEILQKVVVVEAENKIEALSMTESAYYHDNLIELNAEDLKEQKFEAVEFDEKDYGSEPVLAKDDIDDLYWKTGTENDYEYDYDDGYEDDSDRGCKDCPPDECTGHCMSCNYRPV